MRRRVFKPLEDNGEYKASEDPDHGLSYPL